MTALAIIGLPSVLLTLLLEVREGRMGALVATADGGLAICAVAIACRLTGVI